MAKYGKWLAGGLGWVLGGPIGGILGFVAGSMYDSISAEPNTGHHQRGTTRGDFGVTLLVLSASVMKADGKVLKSELDYVRNFFARQFGQSEANERMIMLRDILKQDFNIQDVCLQVRQYMEMPLKLQLLHYLFGISMADGHVHSKEINQIKTISGYIGISLKDFESIRAMFSKNDERAYQILEITHDATDEEIKKAYRRMAVKYHPDKVSQLGEEVQKAAKEKFQKLNAAYEYIKKERGIV